MATDLENLVTARSQILSQLATIETDTPSYSVDGQSVSSMRDTLLGQLREINAQIAATQGPVEVVSRGIT